MGLVSPDQMKEAAQNAMLHGKEPQSDKDWALVLNFVAFNTQKGLEEPVCKLFATIYECTLSEHQVGQIASYQAEQKQCEHVNCFARGPVEVDGIEQTEHCSHCGRDVPRREL